VYRFVLTSVRCSTVSGYYCETPRVRHGWKTSSDTTTTEAFRVLVTGMESTYAEVVKQLREITALEGISGLLGWDEMVMLPSGSSSCRGDQKAALAGVLYDKRTNPALGKALTELNGSSGLNEVQAAVVRDARTAYIRNSAVPKELAQRMAMLGTTAYEAWVDARKSADFTKFSGSLQEWVECHRKRAACIDPSAPAYDVLLNLYEKGMKSARLDEIFSEARAGLVPLISELKLRGTPPSSSLLKGEYDVDVQAKLCRQIALDLGFDTEKGRLDVSVHPFSGGTHPTDIRMTTRFKKDVLMMSITAAIHETGHSLYDQGRNLDPEWKDLPVNQRLSTGVDESQAILWERMVGLNLPFQHYLLPKLREFFPDFPAQATPEMLYAAQNTIREPSLIRVEADELTYTLHVILRYEIERGLVDGSVQVADVPRLWNEKMQAYLGATPPNDAQGCLQDVHWSTGLMGYFPTYTLGAMYAAQIYQCAVDSIPNLEASIAKGEFAPLRQWLKEKIHRVGSLHASGDELMVAVTGKPLDPQVYLSYLRKKYTALYQL
jgi:carboxypeptidase Taq